jgi:hypothetical protein
MRFPAFLMIAVAITAVLTACSPSSSSISVDTPCNPVESLPGWSGIYSACVSPDGTYTQLTNDSEWDVLLLQVPSGADVPSLNVTLPQGQGLASLVEQTEFSAPVGTGWAVVPPGATLDSASQTGTPVHLNLSVDFSGTAENVSAEGLVGVVQGRVDPVGSEAQAIVTCAKYVNSLPQQINQSQPSSPAFWNNFSSTADCSHAFSSAAAALNTGESAVLDDAASVTSDFFDDILPKLVSLAADSIFS